MKKKYDAVKEMRTIRDRISKEQVANPNKREKRLKEIRKKYKITLLDKI